MLLRLRIRAPGVPVRVLVNLIAGVDVDVGAFSLVVRVELDTGLAADVTRVDAVSTVACAVAAGLNS